LNLMPAERIECFVSARRVRSVLLELFAILGPVVVGHALFHLLLPVGGFIRWLIPALYGIAFVACAIVICTRWLQKGPQIVLDQFGIEDRRQSLGVVEWCDIQRVSIREIHGAEFLALDVENPEKYLSRLSRWSRWGSRSLVRQGYPAIAISFTFVDPSLDQVLQFIQRNHAKLI